MTREELLAQAEALEEMAEHLDGLHLLQSRDECLKKARELRAQADSMEPHPPHRQCGCVDCENALEDQINGAARQAEQSPGEVAPITGTAGSIPAAAPPDLAARVAELESIDGMLEMLPTMLLNGSTQCPLCGQSEIHTHTPSEIIIYRNGVKYGRGIGQTHAIAERVRELEALLTDIDSTMTALYESDLGRKWVWPTTARQTSMLRLKEHINAISAALAKGE